jgi:hypothetical protein
VPKAVLTGASESASSSKKSAFSGRLTGRSHSSEKIPLLIYRLLKTAESDTDYGFFFDLRGNLGGGIGGLRIMSYLAPPSIPIGFSIDRKTADRNRSAIVDSRLDPF